MRRRRFIALGGLAACLVVWPLTARAQRTGKIPRIGVLWANGNVEGFLSDALRQGLSHLGHVDGETINLEHRFVGERYDRVDALAAELVESGIDILVMQPQTPWQQSVPQRQFR